MTVSEEQVTAGALAEPPAGPRRSILTRRGGPNDLLRSALPLVVVIIALSLFTNSRNASFLTGDNIDNILVQSAVLGILVVGQTFLIIGGEVDLSVGSMVSFTSVLGAWMYTHGWSPVVVAVTLLVVGTGVGLLWGLLVAHVGVPSFILTVGGLGFFSSLALILSQNRPISVASVLGDLGFATWLGLPALAVIFLAVCVVGAVVLHSTRFGRQVFAVGSSEQTAFLAGLPTKRITVTLFVVNGLLVGLAGIVQLARLSAGDPTSGAGLELSCIAAVVLGGAALTGGRGSMIGGLLGTLLFGVISASLVFLNIGGSWKDFVTGAVLIFAVTMAAVSYKRGRRSTDTARTRRRLLSPATGNSTTRTPRR
ncbi:ABC transporter permease [Pseudonocardia benzenivorans]|uniref:ABC transporter permease n=1 Tax=Pseudonocardia benzenivorans TaxID=228005 RepID=A0ABW3VJV6_9PSEU